MPEPRARIPRLTYLLHAVVTITFGLLARHYLPALPAKYTGVALYAVMMVFVVKFVRPSLPPVFACTAALAICFAIEAFQVTPLPARINAHFPPLRYVLGEVFSWWDLPAYVVGVAFAYVGLKIAS